MQWLSTKVDKASSQIWGAQVFSTYPDSFLLQGLSEYFGRKGFSNMTAYLDPACQGCSRKKKSCVSEKFSTSSWPLIYYLLSYMYICFFFVINVPLSIYIYMFIDAIYLCRYIYIHIFLQEFCVHDIIYFVFTCGCLRCSLQCWVESS